MWSAGFLWLTLWRWFKCKYFGIGLALVTPPTTPFRHVPIIFTIRKVKCIQKINSVLTKLVLPWVYLKKLSEVGSRVFRIMFWFLKYSTNIKRSAQAQARLQMLCIFTAQIEIIWLVPLTKRRKRRLNLNNSLIWMREILLLLVGATCAACPAYTEKGWRLV